MAQTRNSNSRTPGSQNKSTRASANASQRRTTSNSRTPSTTRKAGTRNTTSRSKSIKENMLLYEVIVMFFFACSLIMMISIYLNMGGAVGVVFRRGFFGGFGIGAYILPILIFVGAFLKIFNKGNIGLNVKLILCGFLALTISAFGHIVMLDAPQIDLKIGEKHTFFIALANYFSVSAQYNGTGGFVGGLVGDALMMLLGKIGSYIVLCLLFGALFVLITEQSIWKFMKWLGGYVVNAYKELAEEWKAHQAVKLEHQMAVDLEAQQSQQMSIDDLKVVDKATAKSMNNENTKTIPKDVHVMNHSGKPTKELPKSPKLSVKQLFAKVNLHTPHEQDWVKHIEALEANSNEKIANQNVAKDNDALDTHIHDIDELELRTEDVGSLFDQYERVETPINVLPVKTFEPVSAFEPIKSFEPVTGDQMGLFQKPAEPKQAKTEPKTTEKPVPIEAIKKEILLEVEEKRDLYKFPPLDILKDNPVTDRVLQTTGLDKNAEKLELTLESFGVRAKVINTSYGPAVTRYELQPEIGVKVSKIVNLADDIALNLAASGIRIEAPIPGKSAVGIEVPNKEIHAVFLKEVIDTEEFKKFPSKLAFALGKDISGKVIVADIAKMPHLLIAGATGSGKSVCINTLIASILFKASPKEVKLLMIDPKVVELSIYNGIPHLLIPVVTDPKKAAGALNWAVQEMSDRYKLFAAGNVRDINGYNRLVNETGEMPPLPQIVIIVDELADLMMVAPGDVEDAICRLAQMARAAGIHLIIATQRPSVDVITGLIKANVPSRIAFSVSSGIDSRTIIDMNGAEKLLGKGDMLFYPVGIPKPIRVQGGFVSDKEVEHLVDYLKEGQKAKYNEKIMKHLTQTTSETTSSSDDQDEYFDEALKICVDLEKASASLLQRKFRVGYNRAARIIDQLHEAGFVGPDEGSKPRKVLLTKEAYYLQKKALLEASEAEAIEQDFDEAYNVQEPYSYLEDELLEDDQED